MYYIIKYCPDLEVKEYIYFNKKDYSLLGCIKHFNFLSLRSKYE